MEIDLNKLNNPFDDIYYIEVTTEELSLKMIPFYTLPSKTILELYNKKNDHHKFLKAIYKLIHISMENPNRFKDEVYNKGITYSGLFDFFNRWITVSALQVQETQYMAQSMNTISLIEQIINKKLTKNEEINKKLFIRYLIEHIKETAYQYNKTAKDEDKILEIVIKIPIGDEDYEID